MSEAPKKIRKAATVLLLRPADTLEVFMVQRPGRGTFPNLHVFPGGKVDDADRGLGRFCAGLSDDDASSQLALPDGGLRYWVTAIRECFEECGVLLAYRDGELFEPRDDAEVARFDGYRNALAAGELQLEALAERERLLFAADRLLYFSHWITPPSAPARFDTRFFVAAMPTGQRAVGHRRETVSGTWIAPREALAHQAAGRWEMIHPTLTTLGTVARYDSVDGVMRAVAERSHIGDINANQSEQGMQRD